MVEMGVVQDFLFGTILVSKKDFKGTGQVTVTVTVTVG